MARKLTHWLVCSLFFPFMVGMIVYFGYVSNFTTKVFHRDSFSASYKSGVYRYRVLGRRVLLKTHRVVQGDNPLANGLRWMIRTLPPAVYRLDPEADRDFYVAYFLLNTVCMAATGMLVFTLLVPWLGMQGATARQMIAVLLMGLTQYVVCPYDALAEAFLVACLLLMVRHFKGSFALLIVMLALAAMTHEFTVVALSFYAALRWRPLLAFDRGAWVRLGGLIAAFVGVYFALRFAYGFGTAFFQSNRLIVNFTKPGPLVGMISLPAVSYAICAGTANAKKCLLFFLFTAPYWMGTAVVAGAWEIRHWVPIWLGLLCLASLPPETGDAPDNSASPGPSPVPSSESATA